MKPSRQEKLVRLSKIVVALRRDIARGKRLFFVPSNEDCRYYRSERTARIENKQVRDVLDNEGCWERSEVIYPDVQEIDLADILTYLTKDNPQNPFTDLHHSYRQYPYKWMQDLEDLFLADPNDGSHSKWNEELFPV